MHTDYSTPRLYDQYYCARVSHHHYWFTSYADLLAFAHSEDYDTRMTVSFPANSKYANY